MSTFQRVLNRSLKPLKNGLALMVFRALTRISDDSGKLQLWQVDGLPDETLDDVERFGAYGFTSRPHPGAETICAAVGGTRSHTVIIAVEDRRYRLKSLKEGEAALYDDLGQIVYLTRDGIRIESPLPIKIESQQSVDIAAPEITLTANLVTIDANVTISGEVEIEGAFKTSDQVDLGGDGGQPVARVGDAVAGGVIIAGSPKVRSK